MSKVDPKDIQQRMDRISEIFTDIVSHAETVSKTRCPYRNRHDHCTAEFRCRNQQAGDAEEAPLVCGHEGEFDYRSAWESNPLLHDRAKKKIDEISSAAAKRRAGSRRKKTD